MSESERLDAEVREAIDTAHAFSAPLTESEADAIQEQMLEAVRLWRSGSAIVKPRGLHVVQFVSDEQCDEILQRIDQIAVECDSELFGLPFNVKTLPLMRAVIREVLKPEQPKGS